MRDILVGSFNIVNYFRANKDSTLEGRMELIAQNEEYGVEIYLSAAHGAPVITVMADDIQQYEITTDVFHLEDVCRTIYDRYLDNAVSSLSGDNDEDVDLQDDIDVRENELDTAVDEFLEVVLQTFGYDYGEIDEIHDDVKEHFLEYLYRRHGIEIYRPMFLEDEDGTEFFEEYPYECMVFEDEDNPMYMKGCESVG